MIRRDRETSGPAPNNLDLKTWLIRGGTGLALGAASQLIELKPPSAHASETNGEPKTEFFRPQEQSNPLLEKTVARIQQALQEKDAKYLASIINTEWMFGWGILETDHTYYPQGSEVEEWFREAMNYSPEGSRCALFTDYNGLGYGEPALLVRNFSRLGSVDPRVKGYSIISLDLFGGQYKITRVGEGWASLEGEFMKGILSNWGPCPEAPPQSPQIAEGLQDEVMVYQASYQGNRDIFLKEGEKEPRPLTNTSARETTPVFSPDGKKILYGSYTNSPASGDIWVMDADGQNKRKLTQGYGAVWTPDGNSITFMRLVPDKFIFQVWMRDLQGGKETLVHAGRPPRAYGNLSWSPDGKTLAIASSKDAARNNQILLYPYNKNTGRLGEPRVFGTESTYYVSPRFSPDGKKVSFISILYYGLGVHVLDVATGRIETLVSGMEITSNGGWSGDGKWLLFSARPGGASGEEGIFAVSADGKTFVRVIDLPGNESSPSLRPAAGETREIGVGPVLYIFLQGWTGKTESGAQPVFLHFQETARSYGADGPDFVPWSPNGGSIAV